MNLKKVEALVRSSGKADAVMREVCEEIITEAKAVYSARAEGDNRLSETSPPKYLESFSAVKTSDGNWAVVNDDPGAAWVEFGAHAGGRTPVLKYAPLRTAVDNVMGKSANE